MIFFKLLLLQSPNSKLFNFEVFLFLFSVGSFFYFLFPEMNNEYIKYAMPACTHLDLFCLFILVFLSLYFQPKLVHMRHRAPWSVPKWWSQPSSVAPAKLSHHRLGNSTSFFPSFLSFSCFEYLPDGCNITFGSLFPKGFFYFFGHEQALNKSNFFSIAQKTVYPKHFWWRPTF